MMNKALQVWSPMLSELNRFHWDIDELFDRWFGSRMGNGTGNGVLKPALESFVADGKLVVRVDLPGIEPKDVEVKRRQGQRLVPSRGPLRQLRTFVRAPGGRKAGGDHRFVS